MLNFCDFIQVYVFTTNYHLNCACLSWALVNFCVCPSFSFGIEGGMWDVIVLIPDHCLSIYFKHVDNDDDGACQYYTFAVNSSCKIS